MLFENKYGVVLKWYLGTLTFYRREVNNFEDVLLKCNKNE